MPEIKVINTEKFFGIEVNNQRFSLMGNNYSLAVEFEYEGSDYCYLSEFFNKPGLYKMVKWHNE